MTIKDLYSYFLLTNKFYEDILEKIGKEDYGPKISKNKEAIVGVLISKAGLGPFSLKTLTKVLKEENLIPNQTISDKTMERFLHKLVDHKIIDIKEMGTKVKIYYLKQVQKLFPF